jgi:membrane carboxypeptidase/penicillin-binding protein PbpC
MIWNRMKPKVQHRSWIKQLGALLLLAAFGLIAWESYALWRAERQTPAILASWRGKALPPHLVMLTPEQREILLVVEDPGFDMHKGIDLTTPGQGLTTITQALVKFFYFERFRPGFAKIEQSLIARFILHNHMSKEEQLKLFVSHARFGTFNGQEVTGFAQAAEAYFGKPFHRLTREDYIGLVSMLIAPNEVRPDKPAAFGERVARIDALLAKRCAPSGLLDTLYSACAGKN